MTGCEAWLGYSDENGAVACGKPGRPVATNGGTVELCPQHEPRPRD